MQGRKQIEANQTPAQYLKMLQEDPQYQNEDGFTLEEWLMKSLTILEETDQVIDDCQGHGKFNYNLAGYFPMSDVVSYAYWYRSVRRASLGGHAASARFSSYGARSGVRVG